MMATMKLNLVSSDGKPQSNSIATKRNRLINGLRNQIKEIDLHTNGHWSPRMWFWQGEDGSYRLEARYAKKPLEFEEGKTAIVCKDEDQLRKTIDHLIDIVRVGELDPLIEERSSSIRKRFTQ
jgi:hypothetical protein